MLLLLEYSSFRELQLILKYFNHSNASRHRNIHTIWNNTVNTCNSRCIVCIKNNHWDGYNPYSYSGPGGEEDWSVIHNTPVYTIDYVIEHFPELII